MVPRLSPSDHTMNRLLTSRDLRPEHVIPAALHPRRDVKGAALGPEAKPTHHVRGAVGCVLGIVSQFLKTAHPRTFNNPSSRELHKDVDVVDRGPFEAHSE